MTRIRIPHTVATIAPDRMAALVTHALVAPTREDDKAAPASQASWVRWFEARGISRAVTPSGN
jgi:hypothetical protein